MLRFRLFPRQGEFLRWIEERETNQEDGVAVKSRDVGFTWLCCGYALHHWLFQEGFSAGFGSVDEDKVDRIGDPDSIFEKIRILYRSLPSWMMPAGFKPKIHDNFLRIVNPANGSTISGECGDDIGRGGRKSIYFIDEAAHLARPHLVEASLSATADVRIWVSTPRGPGNPFAVKVHSGKFPVFRFHWKDDPRKDAAWYARQVEKLDSVTLAQEVDMDFTASIEGIVCPAKWVRAAVEYGKRCLLPISSPLVAGLDVAGDGDNADRNVMIPRRAQVLFDPIDWGGLNTPQSAWKARGEAIRLGVTALNYDVVGIGEGVKGTWDVSETPLEFEVHPVSGGEAPSERIWPDEKTSKEKFLNLRAELWWLMRERLRKTWEFIEGGIAHAEEELIALPDHPTLISDLSLPLSEITATGKIRIESKEKMRARGVKSPDFADAAVYSLYEPPETVMEFMVY